MGTINTLLKVSADTRSAVAGFKPLQTSLKQTSKEAAKTEKSLDALDDKHKISIDDDAIQHAEREIRQLRQKMARDLKLGADTKLAQRRIRELQSSIRTLRPKPIKIEARVDIDKSKLDALRGIDIGGKLSKLGPLMHGIGSAISVATLGLSAFATAAGAGVVAALSLADQMANAKIAFAQFLGGSEQATKFLDELSAFAAKTPFEFPELIDSSKKLLAFGIKGKDIIGLMTTLGDAAALTGANVSDLATIWGQMQAKGKVSNEELLQLTEAGIPGYGLLAQAMGKSVGEIQKMAEEGKLLSNDVLPILQGKLNKTFGGGMAKQAETLSGKLSTLKDTLSGFGRSAGEALTPLVDALAKQVQPKLDELSAWATQHKGQIALVVTEGLAEMIEGLGGLLVAIGGVVSGFGTFVGAIHNVAEAIGNFLINLGAMINVVNGFPGIGNLIPDQLGDNLIKSGKDVRGFGADTEAGLKSAGAGLTSMGNSLKGAATNVRNFGVEVAAGLAPDDVKARIAEVNAELKELGKKPPTAQVEVDIKAAKAKLKELKASLKQQQDLKTNIKINADIKDANAKRKEIVEALANLSTKPHTAKVKGDIKHWQGELKKVNKELQTLQESRPLVGVDLDIHNAQAKKKSLLAELADLSKQPHSPKVDAKIEAAKTKLAAIKKTLRELQEMAPKPAVKPTTDPTALAHIKGELAEIERQKLEVEVGTKLTPPAPILPGDLRAYVPPETNVPVTPLLQALQTAQGASPLSDITAPKTTNIAVTETGSAAVKSTLDATADDRKAVVAPEIHSASYNSVAGTLKHLVESRRVQIAPIIHSASYNSVAGTLAHLTEDRYVTVHVNTVNTGGGGGGGGNPPGPGGQLARVGPAALMATGLAAASTTMTRSFASTTGGVPTVAVARAEPVHLAPKQASVKVFLDGAEIADALAKSTNRVVSRGPLRRTA